MLSSAQNRAKDKLTDQWQSAYELGEDIRTMNVLAQLGFARKRVIDPHDEPKRGIEFRREQAND